MDENEILLDVPADLMERIEVVLKRYGISIQQFIDDAIAEAIQKWDAEG